MRPTQEHVDMARRLTAESPPLQRFFNVEIRNEAAGGVSPSDLASALDSLGQAPNDILDDWFDGETVSGLVTFADVAYLAGWDAELRDLLP